MKLNRRNFTLIELLTVIAIIAVLAGILLPVMGKIRSNAKKTKARAQMNSLLLAIKSYESTYGVLPGHLTGAIGDDDIPKVAATDRVIYYPAATEANEKLAYDRLLEMLTCVDTDPDYDGDGNTSEDEDTANTKTGDNVRKVRFLDAPDKFATESFLDPWGRRFAIALDLDYDNQVDIDGAGTLTAKNGNIFIWSFGPNGENKTADTGNQWGEEQGSGNDDISTWKN